MQVGAGIVRIYREIRDRRSTPAASTIYLRNPRISGGLRIWGMCLVHPVSILVTG